MQLSEKDLKQVSFLEAAYFEKTLHLYE